MQAAYHGLIQRNLPPSLPFTLILTVILFEFNDPVIHIYSEIKKFKAMIENSVFEEQWILLKEKTGMKDIPLQQSLEHFIFRQYDRMVLVHYIKALSALELSHHFYLRFRSRSRSLAEPILYWTALAETTIHMTLQGVKDVQPPVAPPARSGAASQLDMLKDCYLLYLRDRQHPCWPPASLRSRVIRNKWNAPALEASYFPRLCLNNTDRHYANLMNILLREILHFLGALRQIRDHGKNLLALRREQHPNASPEDAPSLSSPRSPEQRTDGRS